MLSKNQNHADALHHIGISYLQKGQIDLAISWIQKSIECNPNCSDAFSNLGYCLNLYGKFSDAITVCEKAVLLDPTSARAWTNLGNAQRGAGVGETSNISYQRALDLEPTNHRYMYNLANSLFEQKKFEEAKYLFEQSLSIESMIPEVHNNYAACLLELRDASAALKHANFSVRLKPHDASAWNNRGVALSKLGRYREALSSYERATKVNPEFFGAWVNLGSVHRDLHNHEKALVSYERSIYLKPNVPEGWSNRANVFNDLKLYQEAVRSCDKAIELDPNYAEAWSIRGSSLIGLKLYDEALISFEKSFEIDPNLEFLQGFLLHTKMTICDWDCLEIELVNLTLRIKSGEKASTPFALLGLLDSPELQKSVAEIYATEKFPQFQRPLHHKKSAKKEKIRIGYFSADFHNHATMHLMAELFEEHDKNKFEIFGFSFGPDHNDGMRRRAESAFDKFIDVTRLSDSQVAGLCRENEIDIAIDLKGYTQDSRPRIFAERAAPIQINYLGFPGTMGTQHLDYLIADPTLIPADAQEAYSEKIIYLPNSFQCNDTKRKISDRRFARREVGLPENGFVFCCFNNNWKILPEIFDIWMQILDSADKSILWLFEDNPYAAKNLCKEANNRNVNPERLVFAKRMPHAEHLARYKLADLFLDTFPYNAHTTASDALWAGTPILTLQGKSFAARVASSLLTNLGIPELIAHTKEEYFSLAIELASDPVRLAAIKTRLEQNRLTMPLFDTKLFARHIESAYLAAYNRYHSGMASDHIYVG